VSVTPPTNQGNHTRLVSLSQFNDRSIRLNSKRSGSRAAANHQHVSKLDVQCHNHEKRRKSQ